MDSVCFETQQYNNKLAFKMYIQQLKYGIKQGKKSAKMRKGQLVSRPYAQLVKSPWVNKGYDDSLSSF